MPKPILALLTAQALAVTLFITMTAVFAKTAPTTHTLPVVVDGITRTLTIVVSGTNVLSATVAPISDTFKVTATGWLSNLWGVVGVINLNGAINITDTNMALDQLLTATEETPYAYYWTPFVRQYRFAIHNCRAFVQFGADNSSPLLVAPLAVSGFACREQYQDAYVEMERTAVNVTSGRFQD